jgi:hypothetical protein
VLPSKNARIHRRDAEYAACPRRLAPKWTLTHRRSPLAGDPAGMPADRTRAPHPSPGEGCCPQRMQGFTAETQSTQRAQGASPPSGPLRTVGARLRATRQGCRRIGRERRALPRRRVLLSKNIKIHRRDAEYAACPRRLARKWTFTRRRSPLAGDPAGMPADRTRAPHPSREKGAAIKECKDSPQRRRGATLKGPSKAISLRGCMGTKPLFVFLKNLKNQTIQYDFPLFVRRDQDDFR